MLYEVMGSNSKSLKMKIAFLTYKTSYWHMEILKKLPAVVSYRSANRQ